MAIPGTRGGQYTADGLTHTERGIPTSSVADHARSSTSAATSSSSFNYGDHWATIEGDGDVAVMTWGSLTGAVREAIAQRPRRRVDGAPDRAAPAVADAAGGDGGGARRACKRLLVVEQSHSAQFHRYLRAHYDLPAHGAGAAPARTAADPPRRNPPRDHGLEITDVDRRICGLPTSRATTSRTPSRSGVRAAATITC